MAKRPFIVQRQSVGPRILHTLNMEDNHQKKLLAASMKMLDHMRAEFNRAGEEHLSGLAKPADSVASCNWLLGMLLAEALKSFKCTHPDDVQLILEAFCEQVLGLLYPQLDGPFSPPSPSESKH
jgi:hypothetical protein